MHALLQAFQVGFQLCQRRQLGFGRGQPVFGRCQFFVEGGEFFPVIGGGLPVVAGSAVQMLQLQEFAVGEFLQVAGLGGLCFVFSHCGNQLGVFLVFPGLFLDPDFFRQLFQLMAVVLQAHLQGVQFLVPGLLKVVPDFLCQPPGNLRVFPMWLKSALWTAGPQKRGW